MLPEHRHCKTLFPFNVKNILDCRHNYRFHMAHSELQDPSNGVDETERGVLSPEGSNIMSLPPPPRAAGVPTPCRRCLVHYPSRASL